MFAAELLKIRSMPAPRLALIISLALVVIAAVIVAISAPTSLALARAREHDMTLCAIARSDTLTVFCGGQRLVMPD